MKTSDLNPNLDDIHNVLRYTMRAKRSPTLNRSLDNLIKIDRYTYQGPMFRAIDLDPKEILRFTFEDFLEFIHSFEQHQGFNYISWSKSVRGMNVSIHQNATSGGYDYKMFFAILIQTGKAVDTFSFIKEDPTLDVENLADILEPEEEVLSRINQSAAVLGFLHNGKTFSTFEDFKEYIKNL
jgi:hypothetical protein